MINDPLQVRIQIQPVSSGAVVHTEAGHLGKKCIRISQEHGIVFHFFQLLTDHCKTSSTCTGQVFHIHADIIPDHFFQDAADTDTQNTDIRLVIHRLMGKSIQKSTSVEGFPRKFLISFLQTVDALGKLHLFTVVILMRHVQHVQKFTFTGTFHNVVHTAHGITAVNKNKLLYLSLQHCLDHRFSEATEISMGDLVRKLKILRHFLKNRTFLAKALKQLQRCIFTDVMYHDRFSSLPSDSISRYA